MPSFEHLARSKTCLDEHQIDNLQRLVGSWSLLCDLSYSDLLLYAPTRADRSEFITLGHCRSVTGPTVRPGDPVGTVIESSTRPLIAKALGEGRWFEGSTGADGARHAMVGDDSVVDEALVSPSFGGRLLGEYVPIAVDGVLIAVMVRESDPALMRHAGPIERTYRRIWQRLAEMVTTGEFPFLGEEGAGEFREPRVGDGTILLDREQRIDFASPNAVSALHRLGLAQSPDRRTLGELGIDDSVVARAFATHGSTVSELVVGEDLNVVVRCFPLLSHGRATGALVLVRDISELRSRDRLLLSREVTIREINHRVKNNLQTVQALLRLQARRADSEDAKAAIEESARRIGAIAIVHETLSADVADEVDFDQVVAKVMAMVEEGSVGPDNPTTIEVRGGLGRLPGDTAMPLAVVLTELVQNAIDHAVMPTHGGLAEDRAVTVDLASTAGELQIKVSDNGAGVADGFSLDRDAGLGLTIVRTFVVADLGGNFSIGAPHDIAVERPTSNQANRTTGCVVEVNVPRSTGSMPLG